VFTEREVWQRAHGLALMIREATAEIPAEEQFPPTLPMYRALVSIPANIARGNQRGKASDMKKVLPVVEGQIAEIRYYLHLIKDLGHLRAPVYRQLADEAEEVGKLAAELRQKLPSDA
jgi:four helix bundle protein